MTALSVAVEAGEFPLNERELSFRLGAEPDGELRALTDRYLSALWQAVRCAYCFRESRVMVEGETCTFDFAKWHSHSLSRYLAGAERVYVFAATLGLGADRVIRSAESVGVLPQFAADAVASALIESLCDYAQSKLPLPTRSRFSPGYGDLPLTVQPEVLCFTEAERRIGVRLSESCLMTPTKSVTAIIRIEDHS